MSPALEPLVHQEIPSQTFFGVPSASVIFHPQVFLTYGFGFIGFVVV